MWLGRQWHPSSSSGSFVSESALAESESPASDWQRGSAPIPRPELFVCSTARRALETARSVALESGYDGDLLVTGELYLGGAEAYLNALSRVAAQADCLLMVGHNPDLEDLVAVLAGRSVELRTATLAVLSADVSAWTEMPGSSRLHQVVVARELAPRGADGD